LTFKGTGGHLWDCEALTLSKLGIENHSVTQMKLFECSGAAMVELAQED
jgi:hypothetical protein